MSETNVEPGCYMWIKLDGMWLGMDISEWGEVKSAYQINIENLEIDYKWINISGWDIFQLHNGNGGKQCRSNSSCAQHSLQVFFHPLSNQFRRLDLNCWLWFCPSLFSSCWAPPQDSRDTWYAYMGKLRYASKKDEAPFWSTESYLIF